MENVNYFYFGLRHFTRRVEIAKGLRDIEDLRRIEEIFQLPIICEEIVVENKNDSYQPEVIVGTVYPQISTMVLNETKKTN